MYPHIHRLMYPYAQIPPTPACILSSKGAPAHMSIHTHACTHANTPTHTCISYHPTHACAHSPPWAPTTYVYTHLHTQADEMKKRKQPGEDTPPTHTAVTLTTNKPAYYHHVQCAFPQNITTICKHFSPQTKMQCA